MNSSDKRSSTAACRCTRFRKQRASIKGRCRGSVSGERGLSPESFTAICDLLGLKLVSPKRKRAKHKRKSPAGALSKGECADGKYIHAYVVEVNATELFDGPIQRGVKPNEKGKGLVGRAKLIYFVDKDTGSKGMALGRKWIKETNTYIKSEQPDSMHAPILLNVKIDPKTEQCEATLALINMLHGYYEDLNEPIPEFDYQDENK